MQPMPAKSRSAMIAGVALVAVVVGSLALWSARRGAERTAPDDMIIEEPSDLAPMPSGSAGLGAFEPAVTSPATASPSTGTDAGAPAMSTVPDLHVVQAGETLSIISRMYYKSPIYAGDIEALNELENPDSLLVGQELKLPRPETLGISGGN